MTKYLGRDQADSWALATRITSGGQVRELVVCGPRVRIGRDRRCEIQLEGPQVSRVHAVIRKEGADFVLEDMESLLGTLVGSRKVQYHTFSDGVEFSIAGHRVEMLVKYGQDAASAVAAVPPAPRIDCASKDQNEPTMKVDDEK